MTKNSVALKAAAPYAIAFLKFVNDSDTLFEVTVNIQNLQKLLIKSETLNKCLQNPLISSEAKKEILIRILGKRIRMETRQLLTILTLRNRINLLLPIISMYLDLVHFVSDSKIYQVVSAKPFSRGQKAYFVRKMIILNRFVPCRIRYYTDINLIGGFLIHNDGKIVDYTVTKKLEKLQKVLF